jgi:pilus assembly protein CpaE
MSTRPTNGAAHAPRANVVVALPEGEHEPVVEELLGAGFGVFEAHSAADLAALSTVRDRFDLIVIDAERAEETTIEALRRLRQARDRIPVLFVTSSGSLDAVEGIGMTDDDEVALRPFSADSLRWRVEAMVVRSASDTETGEVNSVVAGEALHHLGSVTPILAIFNPKGGVGKTTIATNLAAALQLHKGRSVLLLDADTVTGHVALSLGLRKVRGIADEWGEDGTGEASESILNLATEHSSGIRVATLTANPLSLPHLNPDRVAELLLEARTGVDAVVVDLHPSYGDVNLAVFATASRVLVPVTPDLPAIRAAVQLTQVANELGVRDRLSLVVNRANSGVSVHDIEQTTGLTSIGEIRSAGMLLVRAGNMGKTLIEQFPREKVTYEFDQLADKVLQLVGAEAPTRERGERWSRGIASFVGSKTTVGAASS